MTNTSSTPGSGSDDPLQARISATLRERDARLPISPLDVAQHDLSTRIARAVAAEASGPLRAKGKLSPQTPWAALSAGLVLLVVLLATFFDGKTSPRAVAHRYTTKAGERIVVTLDDGTRATLAPRSELLVSPEFGRAKRAVSLVGEAYFDVAHATGAPFEVHSGNAVTQVLGTTFGVRHYADDHDVRIAVTTGRVVSRGPSAQVVVGPGAVASVTDSTANLLDTDAHLATRWIDGSLAFENAPLERVLETLGRWYGYTFRLNDSTLAKERITVTFALDNRAQTLAVVQKYFDVTMTFNDTVVTVCLRKPKKLSVPVGPHNSSPRELGK